MAKTKNKTAKKTAGYPWTVWMVWLLLSILAIYWAQERLLYQDSAFSLFRLCNQSYSIDHGRWGNILLIGPAWLGVKVGFNIQIIIYILSLTSILLAAVSSWLIFKIQASNYLYLLPLFVVIGTGPEWFFLGTAEMLPALCFASLSLALLMGAPSYKSLGLYGSALLMILAFYTHPGVVPFLLFIPVIFYALSGKLFGFFTLVVLGAVMVLKMFFMENTTYESGILNGINVTDFLYFYKHWSWQYFIQSFNSRMLMPVVIFLVGLLLGIKNFSWKIAGLLLGVTIFSILMVVTIFDVGDSNMMMEKNFAPVILILFTPILLLSVSDLMHSRFVLVCSIALIVMGSVQRYDSSVFYSQRLEKLDRIINISSIKNIEKSYILIDSLHPDNWRVTWSLPYESLVRSKIILGKSITIIPANAAHLKRGIAESGLFIGADFAYPIHTDTMNHKYFSLSDTGKYKNFYGLKSNSKIHIDLKVKP